jgi:hypothetical protein
MFASKHLRRTAGPESSRPFFSANVTRKNFFCPVVQRQSAKDESLSKEIEATGKSIIKDLEEGKRSLCELSLAFFKAGYTGSTQSTINRQTPEVLDALMQYVAYCGSLSKYITLRPSKLSEGHYKTYRHQRSDDYLSGTSSYSSFDANEWHQAVKAYMPGIERSEIAKIGGLYNRRDDTVNLPADSTFGNALHEAVHRLSGGVARGRLGNYLNEGITQIFTDMILTDIGLPAATGHNYGPNVADARLMQASAGGIDLIAKAYFQDSNDAIQHIFVLLGLIPDAQTTRVVREADILAAIRR